jgi:hypothetical protein
MTITMTYFGKRELHDQISDTYAKLYSPCKHLAVEFKQYIPRKHKHFGIEIYKPCDTMGYTYSMDVQLGRIGGMQHI